MEENNKNEKVVPSYEKGAKNSNTKVKKEKKRVKSKISRIIIIAIIIIVVILVSVGIYKLFVNKVNKTNVDYQSNMKAYGFDIMYDNKTAEPTDLVTKSEAVKMVIASMSNETNITKLLEVREYVEGYNDSMSLDELESKLEYKNKLWVEYAISMGIIEKGEITKDNANDNATFINALVYFANAKNKLLNEILDTKTNPDIKNFDSYRVSEQLALSDMVHNGIIENKEYKFKDSLTKEQFNKLLIDMVLKYNTITVEGEKININKDKEPSNVKEYPYTLASVNKNIYEIKNFVADNSKYKNAKDSYVEMKEYYYDINTIVQEYMETLINVDFEKINDEYIDKILDLSFHLEKEENVKEYLEYVKNNKIKISGSAKVQYPAIYFDGEKYRVRVKVDYKIENANVRENLIYGDLLSKEKIKYDKDDESIIVDIGIKKAISNDLLYVDMRPLKNVEAGKVLKDEEGLNPEKLNQSSSNSQVENIIPTESEIIQDGDTLVVTPKE